MPPSPGRSPIRRLYSMCVLLSGLLAALTCHAVSTQELWQLIDGGKADKAYESASHSLAMEDPDHDLILGIAAAESGHAAEGVTLLRRHLGRYPDHPQNPRARLELGRGFFQLGQLDAAQAEFESVLKLDPPAPVAQKIQQALAAIQSERQARRPKLAGFIEGGLGYDSNVNAGVKDANVNLPIFGNINLDSASLAQDAAVASMSAGGDVTYAPRRDLSLFGSARIDMRFHNNHSDIDQAGYTVAGGAGWMLSNNLLRGSLQYSSMRLDYRTYRDTLLGMGEWSRQIDQTNVVGVYGQVGSIDFSGNNAARNANLYGGGVTYLHEFNAAMRPVLNLSATYTVEDNRAGREDQGRDLWGGRAGLDLTPASRWSSNVALSWQHAGHRADDPFFALKREDSYFSIDTGAGYKIADNWTARLELQWARNDSNLDLYDYERTTVMVKLRRDFR